jgi:hypothetical protein
VARWVEEDFRAYLRCGILAHGFARIRCDDCAAERLVAFSCVELPVLDHGGLAGAESWGHGVARFARPEPIALSHGSAPLNFRQ